MADLAARGVDGVKDHGGERRANVGFIATRLAGTDGVSLEAGKWARVLESEGCECYFLAGELDTPAEHSMLVEEAHFKHPEVRSIYRDCFGVQVRPPEMTDKIQALKNLLKERIREFLGKFSIDLIIAENSLSIPMNIPLGLAITEIISETGIPTIGHHHDFFWERKRFLVNAVWDYINMAFPPHLPGMKHVVINSSAEHQLSMRTGTPATVVPNVIDFDHPPAPPDEYASDVREVLGIPDDILFVLQPTRVVLRKGIEHAIELVRCLQQPAKLVISHASGDEGYEYEHRVRRYSKLMQVDTIFLSGRVDDRRGTNGDGGKVYELADIYPHADLVTYPSDFEGFGNAFLEAVYFRKPIVVNTYSIYVIDIKPKGFVAIELDGYVNDEAVRRTREILDNDALREEIVNQNYELGRKYYSYAVLDRKLRGLLSTSLGV